MTRVEVVCAAAAVAVHAPQVPAGRTVVADVLVVREARRARHLDPLRAIPPPQVEVEVRAGRSTEIAVVRAVYGAVVIGAAGLVFGLAGRQILGVGVAPHTGRRAVEGHDGALVVRLG